MKMTKKKICFYKNIVKNRAILQTLAHPKYGPLLIEALEPELKKLVRDIIKLKHPEQKGKGLPLALLGLLGPAVGTILGEISSKFLK